MTDSTKRAPRQAGAAVAALLTLLVVGFLFVPTGTAGATTSPAEEPTASEAAPSEPATSEPAEAQTGTPTATPSVTPSLSPTPTPTLTPTPTPTPTPTIDPNAGRPPANAPMAPGTYFSYPFKGQAEKRAIRDRVLAMIKSTWGAYQVRVTDPLTGAVRTETRRGTIRITTWSFNDWDIAKALIAARNRGTSVQLIGAAGVNELNDYKPWTGSGGLRRVLGLYPGQTSKPLAHRSFVKECRGACRGSGGTAHSKFFLFDDVGRSHVRNIVVQGSANLTAFAYGRQWNHATVMWNSTVYSHFTRIFNESLTEGANGSGFRSLSAPGVTSSFFPTSSSRPRDPMLSALQRTTCTSSTGRTKVRMIQYAIYDRRGVAAAKAVRALWNAGCDVRIIYSLSSRPVMKILRSFSGRGPIPMKQQIKRNDLGELTSYNHSKWLAISGGYAGSTSANTVVAGSANLSDFSYACDDQMQQISGAAWVRPFFTAFDRTWRERTALPPGSVSSVGATERRGPSTTLDLPPGSPVPTSGRFRYLEP